MSELSLSKTLQHTPGLLTHWTQDHNRIYLYCDDGVILQVSVLTDSILRFRFSTEGYFLKDFSYAIDPDFDEQISSLKVSEKERHIIIRTNQLVCKLKKKGLTTRIFDRQGQLILGDDKGFHWEKNEESGGNHVFMSKKAFPDENYFGLGDKSCHLNLRGERLNNWVTDCFGYGPETDPLYRSIPFYYGLNEGDAYGVFFDNSFRTYFDFAKEREDATSFWAHGGEMNYYFFYGPELTAVAEQYTLLTGRAELPPLWGLGFHQCKWSYYPETKVKEIAQQFRDLQIPCDAIYLDIDYMDGYRCFTWNHDHFPDPARMLQELREQGYHTVVIIDPGIKIDPDYWVFQEGLEGEHFLRRPDGPYAQGKVWPGECYFPDYTHPETREWWSGLFKDLIRKMGVNGVWNDMNEPAVFDVPSKTLPKDVRFHYEGHNVSHLKAHNIYGMQMARATYEGVKEFVYPNRPVMITRATYSGGQRYSSVWTGDNVASWEHLELASTQCQRLSISGFSYCGSDIGGFNDTPDGELFVRWLQLGIFHPLCRVHSIGYHDLGDAEIDEEAVEANIKNAEGKRDQEPWSFGEPYTSIARKTIELRYRLLPILYTAFWQYVERGTPILRPLSFWDQHDPETLHRMEEFSVGDHLMVCPISDQGAEGRSLYLPKGMWYDFNTDQPVIGEQEIWSDAGLDQIPMYVRAGGILPLAPVMQFIGERMIDVLELHIYYLEGSQSSELYVDAGEGYDYQSGKFLLHQFHFSGTPTGCSLSVDRSGDYQPEYTEFRLVFHGLPFRTASCLVDGQEASVSFQALTTEVTVPVGLKQVEIL
ncbi:MAG: glycoside hydrolase family 31 protein [Bacteroidota bacterium]